MVVNDAVSMQRAGMRLLLYVLAPRLKCTLPWLDQTVMHRLSHVLAAYVRLVRDTRECTRNMFSDDSKGVSIHLSL